MSLPLRLSYAFIALLFVAADWLRLATPLVTVFFCYFALSLLALGGRKWLAVTLFLVALAGAGVGFYFFIKHAIVAVPKIAETTIPVVLEWAETRHIPLPFTDYAEARQLAVSTVQDQIAGLTKHAGAAA